MPKQAPTYRNLSGRNSETESVWEIHTPKKNSLYWSIIIAYLLPTVYSKKSDDFVKSLKKTQSANVKEESVKKHELNTESNINHCDHIFIISVYTIIISCLIFVENYKRYTRFSKRLKNLTGDNVGTLLAMNKVKRFNPFKNKHEFPFESSMTDILKKFKKLINANSKNEPRGSTVGKKLAAASKMLKCNIQLYLTDSTGIQERTFYSSGAQSIDSGANADTMIIFQHDSTKQENLEDGRFGFGMELEIAQSLREKALAFVLRKDKFLKENKATIMKVTTSSDNFLVSLLESDIQKAIPRIYKSPYILMKLSDAGYNTNPVMKGSDGFSAFYSCISLPDPQYFHMLYNYASNHFYHSDESCKKRVDEIARALDNVRLSIKEDFDSSNQFASLPSIAKHRYLQILRFNEYQMEIMRKIRHNLQSSNESIVLEISDILNVYFYNRTNYFLYGTPSDNEKYHFENYLKFSDYYENLDSYTCMLLFDRFISGQNKVYSYLVEPLFLMMMSNNYFPHKEHDHEGSSVSGCRNCAQRQIAFRYRKNFSEALKTVYSLIPNSSPGKISADEVVLKSIEIIPKDEFLLSKLKTSLKTAINVEVGDVEGRLTIFNALRIFGEVLSASETENFPSGFLLSAQIPYDIEKALCDIRNDISHYKGNVIRGRLKLENRIKLAQRVQAELRHLYRVLEPIFVYRRFKMKEFVIERAKEKFHISINDSMNIAARRENWYKKNWNQFKSVAENIFALFKRVLKKKPFPKMNEPKKYSKRIKRLKDGADALNFVVSFKAVSDDLRITTNVTKCLEELKRLRNIIEPLEDQEPSADDIKSMQNTFNTFVSLFNIEVGNLNVNVRCPNLIYLQQTLKNYNVFDKNRNTKIRTFISNILMPSFEATLKLEDALQNNKSLQNINDLVDQTFLTIKKRNKMKKNFLSKKDVNLKILKKCSYNSEKNALGEEKQTTEMILNICEKEEYKKALLKQFSSIEDKS